MWIAAIARAHGADAKEHSAGVGGAGDRNGLSLSDRPGASLRLAR
jgi:hypothetical protein